MDLYPVITALFAGIFVGVLIGSYINDRSWQSRLVKRGLAQYNPTTGKWEWKE